MKKIVVVGPVYPYKGGIAHYTSLLYKALDGVCEVRLISYKMQYPRILFRKKQKDYSDKMFMIENAEFLLNTAHPMNIINTAKYINKLCPDAVIIQWWHPYFAPCYRILCRHISSRIKVLFTCHNVFPHERFLFDRALTKSVLQLGDGFVVHSKSDEDDLRSICKVKNIRYNPHPTYNIFKMRGISKKEAIEEIREKDDFNFSDDEKLILFFGFVRKYKGLKNILYAMPEIIKAYPETKLMIVGSFDNDKGEYLEIVRQLKIENAVVVKDSYTPDNEVEKYFSASDIVVLPYEDATQSGIVQIAYGFEKPCVVTNVGGLPDVVEDRKTGYVVEKGNQHAIAAAIIDFYQNSRKEEMRINISEACDRFSWENMANTILQLIEE